MFSTDKRLTLHELSTPVKYIVMLKKTTLYFLFLLLPLCASAQDSADKNILDRGVSAQLADLRKREISHLRYALRFSLPLARHEAVTGNATITFQLQKSQDVVLDFVASKGSIAYVKANGRTAPFEWRNEHIILPKDVIRSGANEINVGFTAPDQSLNRNADYMYTLLVPDRARTLFPCFEQPSLKARFSLTLEMPQQWTAVSNTNVVEQHTTGQRTTLVFAETEPLSTYLFSFVAGRMERREQRDGNRTIVAYYRETDTAKVAQLPDIFDQVIASLHWMEQYTGIDYPFSKYDFVILPGFQYGGMEHVGATLYNDRSMFLSANATPDEQLSRTKLIGHETAHMWFGNLVTMDWFNDVWTKEVFANYFGLRMSQPLFPNVNHRLNWMKSYTVPALDEDRTLGTTPIRQQLDNLRNGGLIYGNIVYDKAPVMLDKLVELMGEDSFKEGIREYLKAFAYKNATWDDLVGILDKHTDKDIKAFSQAWVYKKGMPTIDFSLDGRTLTIRQYDAKRQPFCWPQKMDVTLSDGQRDTTLAVNIDRDSMAIGLPFAPSRIMPNSDGRGYGLMLVDSASTEWLLEHWQDMGDETARMSALMVLDEMYQHKRIDADRWALSLIGGLGREDNALIASAAVNDMYYPLRELSQERRSQLERQLFGLYESHSLPSCRTQLLRLIVSESRDEESTKALYKIWDAMSTPLFSEDDYTTMAFQLSVRMPLESDSIIARQRRRINDPDRQRRFDFIARATVADEASRDSLFASLLLPENRRVEPWAATALSYLNHPLRQAQAVKYIRPALEALEDVQRTGDIFFPRSWVGALLRGHRSAEAYQVVRSFVDEHPDYPPMLKNKLLQAAYSLYRANGGAEAE